MRDAYTTPLEFVTDSGVIVLTLTVLLPFADRLMRQKCLLRRCYVEYYDYITRMLNEYDHITLTGTPGIGISVFYLYFVARFIQEHADKVVVVASFYSDHSMQQCRVYKNGSFQDCDRIPDEPEAIYFFDGPPDSEPLRGKMVCFTSPNSYWLNMTAKMATHLPLFLPCWTWTELEAAHGLGDERCRIEELRTNFSLFGGVARKCFQVKDIEEERRDIERRLYRMSLERVRELMSLEAISDEISHDLVHIVPTVGKHPPFADSFIMKFASKWIEELAISKLKRNYNEKKISFAPLQGGDLSKEILREIWIWNIRCILKSHHRISGLTAGHVSRIDIDITGVEYLESSIDACCWDAGTLCLFKFAHEVDLCISAEDIYEELKRRDLHEDMPDMRLIWLVPAKRREYNEQNIKSNGKRKVLKEIARIPQCYVIFSEL